MTNDFIKQVTDMNKTTAASFKALTDINTKAVKAMFEKQSEIFNTVLEAGKTQVSLTAEAKDVTKLVEAQTKLAKTTSEKVVAIAGTTQAIADTYKTELTGWVEAGVKTAQAAAKKAA